MKNSHYERSFKEAQTQILSFFDQAIPLEKQPKYIVDMGCGNGIFLKQIYNFIRCHTRRGEQLKDFPLMLIGVDSRDTALQETKKNLKDVPHIVLKGDLSEPGKLLFNLNTLGIHDPENILHVCSYGNHHFHLPSFLSEGSLNTFEKTLDLAELMEMWHAYLQKIGAILPDNPANLFILESHCLNAEMTKAIFAESKRFHFDFMHLFSDQCLLDTETFVVLAATFKVFDRSPSFCRLIFHYLGEINYQVRHAQPDDLSALENLEKLCWAKELKMPKKTLANRLKTYPEGQFVLALEGKVVGVIYSQRIHNQEDLHAANATNVARLHQADGGIVQLLAININPKVQERRLGDQLLEFMLQRGELIPEIHSVVGVTLCRDFHKQKKLAMAKYIHKRDNKGRIFDPILRFHESHGATILVPVAGYRPKDKKNEGFGVLVHYDIHNRKGKKKQSRSESASRSASSGFATFLEDAIKRLLGKDRSNHFSKHAPLMEMGLDSADILELTEQISANQQCEIEPAFFFQYNNYERILSHFIGRSRDPQHDLTAKISKSPTRGSEQDIAIVGIACRLPGGINNIQELWNFLKSGECAIGLLPEERWDWPIEANPKNCPGIDRGGFIKDIAGFDAAFFRISAKEAEIISPEQRILLELAWEALEDFGYSAEALSGTKTGVFIGASGSDYRLLLEQHLVDVEAHMTTGTSMAVLANRLSYFYNFNGPSIQIDTACSSSLVAVHQAVQSLRLGECSQALVGGINVICHPGNTISYYKAGMLSKDGLCKTFDKSADGYVRSEGAVMLVLKPLQQAIADEDLIHAVIKGTAYNHGGQASGLTVPNPEGQAKLFQYGWQNAGITPDSISYVETHGTGTKLGDPIEIRGLKEAFKSSSKKVLENSCAIGSVKSNLGHLEAAAGITGLLKVILCLKHQALPPSIHFKELNPQINLKGSPFYIVQNYQDWSTTSILRRACVNSFGSGGTNAHAVLEEYRKDLPQKGISLGSLLFILSAKNKDRLKAYAKRLLNYLDTEEKDHLPSLESLVYSLQRRQAMDERAAFFVDSFSQLKESLRDLIQDNPIKGFRGNSKEYADIALQLTEGLTEKIAKLWVKGLSIQDWSRFYKITPARISLPTYPFDRKPYWFKENQPSNKSGKSWLSLAEEWKNAPLIVDKGLWTEKIQEKKAHDVLVISEEAKDYEAIKDVFQKIAELSHDRGNFLNAAYMPIQGNKACCLNDAYVTHSDRPLTIFFFAPKTTPHKRLELLYTCLQSTMKVAAAKPIHFYYCYHEQESEDSLHEEGLAGLFRSIMLESVNHRFQTIAYNSQDILRIIQEWLWDHTADKNPINVPMIRYAGSDRFELQITECDNFEISYSPTYFKQGGTYLMIGALGSVGELICQELGRKYQARLVIFSRRSEDESSEIVTRIESSGASVIYRTLDILDKAELNHAMKSLKKEGLVIHGVIHMARQISEGAFLNKDFKEFSANISAKTEGTLNIDAATKNEPLDFFLIYSSMAAFGNRGLSDYAYACAFQNAMARYRNRLVKQGKRSGQSLSICWGPWGIDNAFSQDRIAALRTHWQQIGMDFIDVNSAIAAMNSGLNSPFNAMGFIAVHNKRKALQALGFEAYIPARNANIYHKINEFEKGMITEHQFADFLDTLSDSDYTEPLQQKIIQAIYCRRHQNWFYGDAVCSITQANKKKENVPPIEVTEQPISDRILDGLEKVLKIRRADFNGDQSFQDCGLDSISGMQLATLLEKTLGFPIQPSWLIEFPTLNTLADKLHTQLNAHPAREKRK